MQNSNEPVQLALDVLKNGDNDNLESSFQSSRFQVAKVTGDDNNSDQPDITDTTHYDTKNIKSLRYYTREALPRVDHYRNINSVHAHLSRPSLDHLHGNDFTLRTDYKSKQQKIDFPVDSNEFSVKFGWIQGVFVRCLLNIWGVMLFLRLSWIVANAGLGFAFLIILLASLVTTITTLSMSAICTNGEVKAGGTYYMISRSLGPEFGGSIGLIFSLANAVAVALYTVGFAESLLEILTKNSIDLMENPLNSIRIISLATVSVLLCIALIGTEWESKTQMLLLVILILAMVNFIIGSFIPPDNDEILRGFIGWNITLIEENFYPSFKDQNFFSLFAIFFPAATGILAGANISGDLKDPQQSIPLGTLLAILVTTLSYLLFSFISASVVLREVCEPLNSTLIWSENCTLYKIDGEGLQGSLHSYSIMNLVSVYGPLIYAGVFAATLSSALASLVSAPKVFQALCKDKLFPFIHFFAKGYGKNNEPRRAYLLAFIIALSCCLIGNLNVIAPIISNFFLAAYCLINFSCFHASFAKSLGFRPSFRYYNKWVSLIGAILCLVVMFIMSWETALVTFCLVLALYIIVLYRKPGVNWGSSTQAQTFRSAVQTVYKLNSIPDHIKTYRPMILVLSGNAYARPALIDFAHNLVRGFGMMICGHIVQNRLSQKSRENIIRENNEWLQKRNIKSFYNLLEDENFSNGAKAMLQSIGIGKLRPNIVLLGYKNNWYNSDLQNIMQYFNIIHEALNKHMALGILRLQAGLDYSSYGRLPEIFTSYEEKANNAFLNASFVSNEFTKIASESTDKPLTSQISQTNSAYSFNDPSPPHTPTIGIDILNESCISNHPEGEEDIPEEILKAINLFQKRQKKGTIDVWWLYDDGGLTLLLPYILNSRKQWSNCKLRVYTLANKKDDLNRDQRNMAALLNKFRIQYSDVIVIPDIMKPPRPESKAIFDNMISKWRLKDTSNNDHDSNESMADKYGLITDSEYLALKDKSYRHLRLHELLNEYSKDATLIVMTLPMPRKGTCSAAMYMSWIEILTRNMPPFLLIRGSQQSVLTFYS